MPKLLCKKPHDAENMIPLHMLTSTTPGRNSEIHESMCTALQINSAREGHNKREAE